MLSAAVKYLVNGRSKITFSDKQLQGWRVINKHFRTRQTKNSAAKLSDAERKILRQQSARRLEYVSSLLREAPEGSTLKSLGKRKVAKYLDHLVAKSESKCVAHAEASHSSKRARIEGSPDTVNDNKKTDQWTYMPLKTQTALLAGKESQRCAVPSRVDILETETEIEAALAHASDGLLDLRPGRQEFAKLHIADSTYFPWGGTLTRTYMLPPRGSTLSLVASTRKTLHDAHRFLVTLGYLVPFCVLWPRPTANTPDACTRVLERLKLLRTTTACTQVASPATTSHAPAVAANNKTVTANNKTVLTPRVTPDHPLGSRQLWQASPCLERCIALIEAACQATPGSNAGGRGLTAVDVGCAAGRDCIYLARRGWSVVGVDHLSKQLQRAREFIDHVADECAEPFLLKRIQLLLSEVPQPKDASDPIPAAHLVYVGRYLDRDLLPQIRDSMVLPGGCVCYHTFMVGCEKIGRPKKKRFLLEHGELRRVFAGWTVLMDEVLPISDGRPLSFFAAQKPGGNP